MLSFLDINMASEVVLVIPAYQPEGNLPELVRALRARTDDPILVVNDGSSNDRVSIFEEIQKIPRTKILTHAINLGKGYGLKTAINEVLVSFPEACGIVTLDADGQHLPEDVIRVAQTLREGPTDLCLGTRGFQGDIPFRSRFGNSLTRMIFKALTGTPISDTQTGLRGIPAHFLPDLLRIKASGYDFEMDMLMLAIEKRIKIRQVQIETVYEPGNPTSHFNPLLDSARIYFVFIRFSALSLLTAALDFAVFSLALPMGATILQATVLGRTIAGSFNFTVSRRLVFRSTDRWKVELLRYASLVIALMLVSNRLIHILLALPWISVVLAKLIAESALFVASFALQRIFVFRSESSTETATPTDWDAYYDRPFPATSVTRRITERRLLNALKSVQPCPAPSVLELGGANSCFYSAINRELNPKTYRIVDNNRLGLEKFRKTYPEAQNVVLSEQDILNWTEDGAKADLCFSAGLIEHFSIEGTAAAIRAHFDSIQTNGAVIITFPTPTFLYRMTRSIAELFGLWAFPDERPLRFEEVVPEIEKYGQVLHRSVIWPIILTQGIVVARPRSAKLNSSLRHA